MDFHLKKVGLVDQPFLYKYVHLYIRVKKQKEVVFHAYRASYLGV